MKKNPVLLRKMKILFVCLFVSLSGCATASNIGSSISEGASDIKYNLTQKDGGKFEISVADGITYFNNVKVYLGDKHINVAANRPLLPLEDPAPNALFVPFGLVQDSIDHMPISFGVSRILWQQFLGEQTFKILEFSETRPPYRVEHAVPMAKAMGANYLVGGYITHFYDGGSSGDSKIAIVLEVYDTLSGALLWSISQTGVLPYEKNRDNVLFKVKNRMPVDSMSTLIAALGKNLAMYLHYWTDYNTMKARETKKDGRWDPSAFGKY